MATLMNTYGTRNLTLTKGVGCHVWDDNGNRYFDAISGIAVCGLGHSHPAVTRAICEQAATLMHTSNLYNIPAQEALGNKLCLHAGMDKVFFSNSGAEANEAALKIARKYGNDQGIKSPTVIVMEHSFHGRTLATLSATGNDKVQAGFAPLVEGFIRAPYNNVNAIKVLAKQHANIVAILVEPVQGEGGVNIPAANYLNELRSICDEQNWLLMVDEIQTGNGRTGRYFAYQHNNILPDVVTTAKGLGNGVPIGACLAQGKAANVLQPGNHGSTFGGNPLACTAALAVIDTITENGFINAIASRGTQILNALKEALKNHKSVIDIRGKGLMIGIELNKPCADFVGLAQKKGLLINVTAGNALRLLPPFIMNDEETEFLIKGIVDLVSEG